MTKPSLLLVGISWLLIAGNCVKNTFILHENPSEQYLNITGTINEGMEYVVSVMYVKNAKESGCNTYGKDSDICQVKPEEFTYTPEIEAGSHALHIPLRELSPGPNSWFEPKDISICVGPQDPNAVPHQCQVLFSVTKDKHDGNHTLDLICTKRFWCYEGLHVEHVSQLNREYVVNIRKESIDPRPLSELTLEDLFKYEMFTEFIERVLADPERQNGPILLVASNLALREQRTRDSLLLYHAGTIRVHVDRKYYTPRRNGVEGPGPAIEGLMFPMQLAIGELSAEQLKNMYESIVPQLENWNPQYVDAYEPGWEIESSPNLRDVQQEFDQAKARRLKTLQGLITLFHNEAYAEAHAIVQAYEWDPTLDQQADEKLEAENTMQRIEAQLGIEGYMSAITKQRELQKSTKCYTYSAEGKQIECDSNK